MSLRSLLVAAVNDNVDGAITNTSGVQYDVGVECNISVPNVHEYADENVTLGMTEVSTPQSTGIGQNLAFQSSASKSERRCKKRSGKELLTTLNGDSGNEHILRLMCSLRKGRIDGRPINSVKYAKR